jgi:hypothetical protein
VTLSYSATNLPTGLSINSTTGLISGTVASGASQNGPYSVAVTVSDGTYSTSVYFSWAVTRASNTAPTLTNPGTQVSTLADAVSLALSASDADGDPLTYTVTGLPDGLNVDPVTGVPLDTVTNGVITGTISPADARATPYAVTVTVNDGQGGTASQTFNWVVNPPAMTLQGATINATEGTQAAGVAVATLTDSFAQESAFTVTINWGDGTSGDPGWVGDANGSLTVNGTHTYAHPGTFSVQATVVDPNGNRGVVSGTAVVAAASLTAVGGLTDEAVAGVSANQLLATFTDANPNDAIGNYTATINWGDGTATTTGTVSSLKGAFGVSGSHTYSAVGTYTATVTVTDTDSTTATVTSAISVGKLYVGQKSNLTAASFTSSDTAATAADFTAQVNWGDGSAVDNTAQVTGSSGTFQVTGTHIYTADGTYTVQATATDRAGRSITTAHSVTVVRSALTPYGSDLLATPGTTLSNAVLARFFDPNLNAASAYTATAYWGDGTAADTTAHVTGANGVFEVVGSHLYTTAAPVFNLIRVEINEGGNKLAQVQADAIVTTLRQAFPVALTLVSFEGGGGYRLYNDTHLDPSNMPVELPTDEWSYWNRATFPQGPQYPFAYVRGSTPQVRATFEVLNPLYNLPNVRIQGVLTSLGLCPWQAPFSIQLNAVPAGAAAIQNGSVTVVAGGAQPLPDKVDYYSTAIQWTASADGVTWYTAGYSENPIYLLYAPPKNSAQLLQTFVDLGSHVAVQYGFLHGPKDFQTNPREIVGGIWSAFSNRTARRADGQPLHYYGSWDFPPTGDGSENKLVTTLDGQCVAWSLLFLAALRAQGLTTDPVFEGKVHLIGVYPAAARERNTGGFLIKGWNFTHPVVLGGPAYPDTNTAGKPMETANGKDKDGVLPQFKLVGGKWVFEWLDKKDATYDAGPLPGQNSDNPPGWFPNHAIVQIGGLYFDPSYGAKYTDEKDFQSQAIVGFYWTEVVPANGNRIFHIRPFDPKGQDAQVKFEPKAFNYIPEIGGSDSHLSDSGKTSFEGS